MNQPRVTDGTPITGLFVTGTKVLTHFYASAVDYHETTWAIDVPLTLEKINYSMRVVDVNYDYVNVQIALPGMSAIDIAFDARSATAATKHTTSVKTVPVGLFLPAGTIIWAKSWQQNGGDQAFIQMYCNIEMPNPESSREAFETPCGILDFVRGNCRS